MIMRLKPVLRAGLFALVAVTLTGCFDLAQHVAIGRDGAGSYRVSLAATGLVGEALKEKPAEIGGMPPPQVSVDPKTGLVRQTSERNFQNLSQLKLPDELISLHVLSRPFFGLGPTHVRFRRTFLIGNASRDEAERNGRSDLGGAVLQSLFGDHTYVFSVTLPGSILEATPLQLGRTTITPTVTGDIWNGHTVTWTMPLALALSHHMLTFEADFSAYGSFGDVESQPGN